MNRKTKLFVRMVMSVMIVLVFLASSIPSIFADDKENEAYSFYNTGSDVAQVMEIYLSKESGKAGFKGKAEDIFKNIQNKQGPGEAGNYLGVRDRDRSKGSVFSVVEITKANSSISYDTLGIGPNGNTPVFGNGDTGLDFTGYIIYGESMKSAGLDALDGNMFWKPIRTVQGILLWAGLSAIRAIDSLWGVVGNVLQTLNPFNLFTDGIRMVSKTQDFTGYSDDSWMVTIGKYIGQWYNALYGLSIYVTIPLMIGFVIAWWLLSKNFAKSLGWLKKAIAILAFFIVLLPLMGRVYTDAIGSMADTGTTSQPVDKYFNSILYDFQTNVEQNGLSTNGFELTYDREAQSLTGKTVVALQNMVEKANSDADSAFANTTVATKRASTGEDQLDASKNLDKQLENIKEQTETAKDAVKSDLIMQRIIAYMTNKVYLASDYESAFKKGKSVDDVFGEVKDKSKVVQYIADGFPKGKPALMQATNDGNNVKVSNSGKYTTVTTEGKNAFSPLATYNYLSSDFQGRSVLMTSATKSSSLIARSNHFSVNIVGGGLLSLFYFLEAVFLTGTLAIVGFLYIAGMMKDSLTGMFTIVVNTFKVGFGVAGGIAKVIGAFVMLLLSAFGTMFMYQIFKEVIFAVPTALRKLIDTIPNGDNAIVASSYLAFKSCIIMVLCFYVGKIAIQNRKQFITGFNETIENVVHQIVGTRPSGNSQPLKGANLMDNAKGFGNATASVMLGRKDAQGNRSGNGLIGQGAKLGQTSGRLAGKGVNYVKDTEAVKAVGNAVGSGLKTTGEVIGNKVSDIGQDIKNSDMMLGIEGVVHNAKESKVGRAVTSAGMKTGHAVSSFTKAVKKPVTKTVQTIKNKHDRKKGIKQNERNYQSQVATKKRADRAIERARTKTELHKKATGKTNVDDAKPTIHTSKPKERPKIDLGDL